ncbi:hypothetical protein DL96DRAFT_1581340 [Flagelloscypha sp. PMI_526]|nr:hypothetical protein DL96DRAFT_1581340 [Flagelloscypha sp. PMI_526]
MFFYISTALFFATYVLAFPMYLSQGARANCDAMACGSALIPVGIDCVEAAVKLGRDPFADASCVYAIVQLGSSCPNDCTPCFDNMAKGIAGDVGDVAKEIANEIESTLNNVSGPVKNAFDNLKNAIGGIIGREDTLVSSESDCTSDPPGHFNDGNCVTPTSGLNPS